MREYTHRYHCLHSRRWVPGREPGAHAACSNATPDVLQIASLLDVEYTHEERQQIGLATSEELAAILDAL